MCNYIDIRLSVFQIETPRSHAFSSMAEFKLYYSLFSIFLLINQSLCEGKANPTVSLSHGALKGSWQISTKGRTYASFRGVPYAEPPIGQFRFQDPQPIQPWAGVWDATEYLSPCLQFDNFPAVIIGREDCLFLNVFTPILDTNASLPVFIFIHGGAFMSGTSNVYDPSHLMDLDHVVVTINYRLGPLGFLSTGDEVVPGNSGLKDQAFALHWVKKNIRAFGGNPDSITLTGNSAGGAAVHYHYMSPWSKGTFARGIAYSGSALAPWTFTSKPLEKAKMLASIVGCPTTDNREMVDCMKDRPGEVVVKAQIPMFEWKMRLFTPFLPTVEASNVKNAFMTKHPYLATLHGDMEKLPLITSVTSEEGLYPGAIFLNDGFLPELEARWDELASDIFQYNDTLPLDRRPSVAKNIKDHYLNGKSVSRETFSQLVQALGDRHFAVSVGKLAQIQALKSDQPVYLYRYCFQGEYSLTNMLAMNKEKYGASHGDDILHIFKAGEDQIGSEDSNMTQALIDMIYSYSTTGIPRPTSNAPEWLPVVSGSSDINYLEITSPSSYQMKTSSDFGQRSFWDSLGFTENENYTN